MPEYFCIECTALADHILGTQVPHTGWLSACPLFLSKAENGWTGSCSSPGQAVAVAAPQAVPVAAVRELKSFPFSTYRLN